MNLCTLINRSLRFHWRAHLGVVLGVAVGSAALIGALVVGDSVRESLRERALRRLGKIDWALTAGDRLVSAESVNGWRDARNRSKDLQGGSICGVLRILGTASKADGSAFSSHVQLIGMDAGFVPMGGGPQFATLADDAVVVNQALAVQLNAGVGDHIILRMMKPLALSREIAISSRPTAGAALAVRVEAVVSAAQFGDFSPHAASQTVALNAFVSLGTLQRVLGITNRVNEILVATGFARRVMTLSVNSVQGWALVLLGRVTGKEYVRGDCTTGKFWRDFDGTPNLTLDEGWRSRWRLQDAELTLNPTADATSLELRTPRVLLAPPVVEAVQRPIDWNRFFMTANRQEAESMLSLFTNLAWRAALDLQLLTNAQPILTYLATLLHAETKVTSYSMVTAAGAPWTPADMRDDEIIVNQWLAEDLHVKPGEEIAMSYFLPESGAKLAEATNHFRVCAIVPMEMPWADRTLMPDFPGIEKAESTSDWDAGFPLVHKIRPKDEDYWKKYRGTPKAFITPAAGQKMWANRFGNLTAIRFPISTNSASTLTPALSLRERENRPPASNTMKVDDGSAASSKSGDTEPLSPLPAGEGQGEGERPAQTNQFETPHVVSYKEALEKKILANLKPEELGLRFEPVREQALKAAEASQDFGGLFLGFSVFLIAAALVLMALLFSLGLEQRAPEIGTLLALGFTPQQVRRLLLAEGVALSLVGGVLGALGGLVYAKAMLHGLTTVWRDAVGATALNFHVTGQTLAMGLFASVIVSVVTIWLTLRKFVRRPARELLVGEITAAESGVQRLKSKVIAVAALLMALGLVGWAVMKGDTANAGAFFGAGALVLVAGMSFASALLRRRTGVAPVSDFSSSADGDRRDAYPTLASLALRGCARRRKRSLATMAMLACGSFLIVSIGVFRLDANRDAWKRSSGTGGFALIGETTMPVVHDLNAKSGRDFFALNERDLAGVSFIPFRFREGDEASCLNLNRAQKPKLLGVKADMLEGRFGFAKGAGWKSLINTRLQPGELTSREAGNRSNGFPQRSPTDTGRKPGANEIEVPAIGDANSIQWAMHKKVGDTIDYVDERGQPFKVRIVGAMANSILQGSLIIDEAEFAKQFPSESGHRMFLIDAPSNTVSQVSATLSRAMQDVGLELTPAAERLARFNAVQNTYLGTFQVLGGLGLLLGSVGLGIVVLRNVLERRGELAVMLAVGFRKGTLQRLLLIENGALLAAGLALGIVAAAVAVLPALLSPGAQLPLTSLALTLGAVLVNGVLWTWAATRLAVRGDLLKTLRNE